MHSASQRALSTTIGFVPWTGDIPSTRDVGDAFRLTPETTMGHARTVRASHAQPVDQPFAWLRLLHQPLAAV